MSIYYCNTYYNSNNRHQGEGARATVANFKILEEKYYSDHEALVIRLLISLSFKYINVI